MILPVIRACFVTPYPVTGWPSEKSNKGASLRVWLVVYAQDTGQGAERCVSEYAVASDVIM